MSQRLPVDGVALVVEGQKKFIADLTQANAAWNKIAVSFDKAGNQTITASKGMAQVGTSSQKAGTGMLAMGTAAGVAMAGINALLSSIQKVGSAIARTFMSSLQLAGQFQEMEFTALAIGRAMGLTEDQIRGASKEIQDLGVRADVANKTVAQFARNQLDLAKASDLVRIAQATGIIIGEDSSATMESLTRAITTGSTVMLRRMGIMVDNAQIEKQLAADLGVTTGELSNQQKMMARTNAIIESSASLLDVYDAAMESPTKRLRSWTGRLLPELQAALGAPFLQAWSTVIEAVSNLTKALTAALSEGGALYPMMIKLGAVASIMADAFATAVNWITAAVTNMSSDIGVGVGQTIEDALRWGVELVAAFAQGMVEASTTVLVQAMNYISQILSSWLLGASPPKIAPGIQKWGINLMDMYLRGMTEADFGILKDIQGPLKKILEGPAFADVSQALAGALAGDDRGAFLETIGKTAGIFGDAITKLAIANFDLADSVVAVQTAEDALAKSRDKLLSSQGAINKATVEYNRLLRAGASEDELQAQLGLINASEDNMRASVSQIDAQEDALAAAKERQSQLEDEEKLQQNIVDQLLQVNDALDKQEKAKAKAGVKGVKGPKGAVAIPGLEGIVPTGFDISSRMGEAIDAMKQQIKDKFKDIFKPLSDAWGEMRKDVEGLGQIWEDFKTKVGKAWEELKTRFPVLQNVETWLDNLPEKIKTVRDWFDTKLSDAIEAVSDTLEPDDDNTLFGRWKRGLALLQTEFWPFLRDDFIPILGELVTKAIDPLAAGLERVSTWIGKVYSKFKEFLELNWAKIKEGLGWGIGESPAPLERGLAGINKQLQVLATTRLPALASMGSQMAGAMAPIQQLAPQSSTAVTMNMGGNTFNGGTSDAVFNARVEQAMRRNLRR